MGVSGGEPGISRCRWPITVLLQAEDAVVNDGKTGDSLTKGNGNGKSKITRRTLSLDELAALMGYTRGEKIVAIDYRT
jgi:hypothetical protein